MNFRQAGNDRTDSARAVAGSAASRRVRTAFLVLWCAAGAAAASGSTTLDQMIAAGDEAYARRSVGAVDGRAQASPIGDAVNSYRHALAQDPERIDVRIRLLRSLFYLARYATPDAAEQKRLYEEGRAVFDDGLARLGQQLGTKLERADADELPPALSTIPGAGELYFWGAVHWGLWGESFGTMASVRKGVAGKIRRFGEAAAALAPAYENGGAYRLLGRLHALAPKVPLFTGWIDHQLAIDYLERAVELAPDDPLNRFFLAEALFEYGAKSDQAKAQQLLDSAAKASPRPHREVEDEEAIRDARKRLQHP
jgi:tetratricopeptide (TPR) repeat protein